MAVYKVLFKASVEKDFAAISKKDLKKILALKYFLRHLNILVGKDFWQIN